MTRTIQPSIERTATAPVAVRVSVVLLLAWSGGSISISVSAMVEGVEKGDWMFLAV